MTLTIAVAAGLAALGEPGLAWAYSPPSGLAHNNTLCSPRAGDYTSPNGSSYTADQTAALAAGGGAAVATTGGGFAGGETVYLSASSSSGAYVYLQVQDAGGAWDNVAQVGLTSANGFANSVIVPDAPGGVVRGYVVNGATANDVVHVYVGHSQQDAKNLTMEQQLTDGCDLAAQDQAQTHGDLGQLHTDLSAGGQLDGDLGKLDADTQGTTSKLGDVQADLDARLTTLESDLKQLHTDLTSSGGTGSDVRVTNWPGSQPVSFDQSASDLVDGDASALHSDVWYAIGLSLGLLLAWLLWRAVGPRWFN